MGVREKITAPGPKKLLAIDGGGIRGVLALEILAKIERLLAKGRPEFRLCQYFDYIAGTSTGGIIAAGLAVGMSVADILRFYEDAGAQMFPKTSGIYSRLVPVGASTRKVLGRETGLRIDRGSNV